MKLNEGDDRFASLFDREEFQQDQQSDEFRLRNPTVSTKTHRRGGDDSDNDVLQSENVGENVEEQFDLVDEDDDEDMFGYDDDDFDPVVYEGADNNNNYNGVKKQPQHYERNNKNKREEEEEGEIAKTSKKMKVKMFAMAEGNNLFSKSKVLQKDRKKVSPFDLIGDRLLSSSELSGGGSQRKDKVRYLKTEGEGLVREMSYIPKNDFNSRGKSNRDDRLTDNNSSNNKKSKQGRKQRK